MGEHGGKAPIPPHGNNDMEEHVLTGKLAFGAVCGTDRFCIHAIRV